MTELFQPTLSRYYYYLQATTTILGPRNITVNKTKPIPAPLEFIVKTLVTGTLNVTRESCTMFMSA